MPNGGWLFSFKKKEGVALSPRTGTGMRAGIGAGIRSDPGASDGNPGEEVSHYTPSNLRELVIPSVFGDTQFLILLENSNITLP